MAVKNPRLITARDLYRAAELMSDASEKIHQAAAISGSSGLSNIAAAIDNFVAGTLKRALHQANAASRS